MHDGNKMINLLRLVLVSYWILGLCQVNLLKTGVGCSGKVYMHTKCFSLLLFVYFEVIQTQNRRPNNMAKTSQQIYKIQFTVLASFTWVDQVWNNLAPWSFSFRFG